MVVSEAKKTPGARKRPELELVSSQSGKDAVHCRSLQSQVADCTVSLVNCRQPCRIGVDNMSELFQFLDKIFHVITFPRVPARPGYSPA